MTTGVVVALTWRFSLVALCSMVVLLLTYQILFGELYKLGVPAAILAPMRFWKEAIILTLVIKVIHQGWGKLDRVDWVGLAMLVLILVFVLLPSANGLYAKSLAARQDGMLIVVFLIARHLKMPVWASRWLESIVLALGVIVAGFAIWNHFAPTSFSNWIDGTGVIAYRREALQAPFQPAIAYDTVAGQAFVRAGSIFLNAATLGFYCLIPIGIAMGRAVKIGPGWRPILAGLLALSALLLSLTRSAIVALPIMLLVVLMVGRTRQRLAAGLLIGTVALYPLAASINLGQRFSAAFDTSSGSSGVHIGALIADVEQVLAHPLGVGLAQAGLAGRRAGVEGFIDNESWYFALGTEMGILGMALYIWFQALVMRDLWRRARQGSTAAAGALAGLVGLGIGGIFLFSFSDLVTAWTVFALAGLALPAEEQVEAVTERSTPEGGSRQQKAAATA
jgi:hypothetical protein